MKCSSNSTMMLHYFIFVILTWAYIYIRYHSRQFGITEYESSLRWREDPKALTNQNTHPMSEFCAEHRLFGHWLDSTICWPDPLSLNLQVSFFFFLINLNCILKKILSNNKTWLFLISTTRASEKNGTISHRVRVPLAKQTTSTILSLHRAAWYRTFSTQTWEV